MDPILTIFAVLLVASVVGGSLWHTLVKHYVWASIASALSVGLITTWTYAFVREGAPHWTILVANVVFAGAIALGIGIPFNRRRTGRGLGSH